MLQTKDYLNYDNKHMGDPCGKYITDVEFLKHMIPHHQVAIDMSKKVMKCTNNPSITYLARNIIFGQTREILHMENVLLSNVPNLSSNDKYTYINIPNQYTIHYPKESRADNPQCGLHHFNPTLMKHHGNFISDKAFMQHMIPHHDVAIEMAERVTKYSKSPLMIDFAYGVIKNQRYEIWVMKTYLKKGYDTYKRKFNDNKKVKHNKKIKHDHKMEKFNEKLNYNFAKNNYSIYLLACVVLYLSLRFMI